MRTHAGFEFAKADVGDGPAVANVFGAGQFDRVVHLAAQAGVRYSIDNPVAYAQSNLLGFTHILEGCRHHEVEHLVYASSSSVYGANTELPFAEHHNVDHPVSFYAASKKANELMAHSYSHLYGLPTTGLRYFTVYGPWGRPDMSPWLFTSAILDGRQIDVFNHGDMSRDYTFIDDIVDGTVLALDWPVGGGSCGGEVTSYHNNDGLGSQGYSGAWTHFTATGEAAGYIWHSELCNPDGTEIVINQHCSIAANDDGSYGSGAQTCGNVMGVATFSVDNGYDFYVNDQLIGSGNEWQQTQRPQTEFYRNDRPWQKHSPCWPNSVNWTSL